jgi:hypothetical protein
VRAQISSLLKIVRTAALAAAIALPTLAVVSPATPVASAPAVKDFDVTGSLDCGVRSGQKCVFTDWETGPKLAMFTKDISGEKMRFEVDASWLRDHLTAFRQDDFVWFVVRDGIGPLPVVVHVVEHRCHDGRFPHGQVAHGLSTRDRCVTPG